ncbi:ribonuclease T2-like isoform X2 [Stegostoma tigrinum]|uniref:ribonuclease T2-like isoform X2 n=1 Tax=Stegostoma tigrinum TaxID=3053191 RepID=UPI0028702CBC|nr:ribonuclease T2-like isoform X2 [Stegostoma tigrinum]
MAIYIGICLAVVYGLTATTEARADMKDSCQWKCLVFSQLWPGSFCMTFSKRFCKIPNQVNGWTIHGLWPDGKEFCNHTWKLTRKEIGNLWTDLQKYWPSLISNSPFKFWQSEWAKHGTCGTCADNMSCPHKYFSLALELRMKFSIDEFLSATGIKPSCYNGYTKRQVLVQIKIFFSKDLSIGCNASQENFIHPYCKPCTNKSEIYLYPFTEHPHNPCS